jgi:hypothetical protein
MTMSMRGMVMSILDPHSTLLPAPRNRFRPPLAHTALDAEMQRLDDEALAFESEREVVLPSAVG